MSDFGQKETNSQNIFLGLVAIVCGIVLALFVVGVFKNEIAQNKETKEKTAELSRSLADLEAEESELEAEIADLDARYKNLIKSVATESDDYQVLTKLLTERNEILEFYCGKTDVTGDGIRVSLDDGNQIEGSLSSGQIVHDTTLIRLVEALRESGAQAISVNEERITASSAFVCVGSSISVNGRKLYAPYSIKAIGGEDLYTNFCETAYYKTLSTSLLSFDVVEKKNIKISAFVE